MIDSLKKSYLRYKELESMMTLDENINDFKKMQNILKEMKHLEKLANLYLEYDRLSSSINDLKEMRKSDDEDISIMAKEELDCINKRLDEIIDDTKILLLPKDKNDEKNVMVEIKGAVGGDEANIFAGDLYRMYQKYSDSNGWKIDLIDATPSEAGGFTNIQFLIKGESIYSKMKYESGGHRVQRVPQTETQGRIHTSIATVLVMPEADEIEFTLNPEDLKFDTFCSSGPGGQSVNTTQSAVRVTHKPTGVAVACQVHKSQHENKAAAIALLKTKLYNELLEKKEKEEGIERKSLVGHGVRSEKIRTYNYPQNRVTDHRIGFTVNRLDSIIDGKLDIVIDELLKEDQARKLQEIGK